MSPLITPSVFCVKAQSKTTSSLAIQDRQVRGAAEKYLKGYLIAQGWELTKTHDLVALLTRCTDYAERFEALREGGAVLNEYIVAGRYPGDVAYEEIGEAEAKEAVAIVRRVEEAVRASMSA
jgi:HEPN domain-containing protein